VKQRPRGRRLGLRSVQRQGRENPGAKVIIVTQGGIGNRLTSLPQQRCLKRKRRIIRRHHQQGLEEKIPEITQFVRRGLVARGGFARRPAARTNLCIRPWIYSRGSCAPNSLQAADAAHAGDDVIVGAMGAHNACNFSGAACC